MDQAIAGHDLGLRELEGLTTEIGNAASSFRDQKRASRHVPRVQPKLPETIEPPGGHIAEVQGGGAGAADSLSPLDEVGEMVQIVLRGGGHVWREAGGEKGI